MKLKYVLFFMGIYFICLINLSTLVLTAPTLVYYARFLIQFLGIIIVLIEIIKGETPSKEILLFSPLR